MSHEIPNDEDPVAREILRILGERTAEQMGELLMILPLVDHEDALAFLRTVPDNAGPEVIQRMATEYRLANPFPRRDGSEQPDP